MISVSHSRRRWQCAACRRAEARCPSATREQDIGGCVERWYIRIINIRIEPVAAPRGSAPALNNILVSKAAAAIFLYTTYKFFGKSDRNESPTTVEAARFIACTRFNSNRIWWSRRDYGPCLRMMHGSWTPNAGRTQANTRTTYYNQLHLFSIAFNLLLALVYTVSPILMRSAVVRYQSISEFTEIDSRLNSCCMDHVVYVSRIKTLLGGEIETYEIESTMCYSGDRSEIESSSICKITSTPTDL